MKSTRQVCIEQTVLDVLTCDMCGATTKNARNWTSNYSSRSEVTVCFVHGDEYPEGGSGTQTCVDLCPQCFGNKLLPWLMSQGATPRLEEWSY